MGLEGRGNRRVPLQLVWASEALECDSLLPHSQASHLLPMEMYYVPNFK